MVGQEYVDHSETDQEKRKRKIDEYWEWLTQLPLGDLNKPGKAVKITRDLIEKQPSKSFRIFSS